MVNVCLETAECVLVMKIGSITENFCHNRTAPNCKFGGEFRVSYPKVIGFTLDDTLCF